MDIPSKKPRYSNSTEESDIPVTRQLPNTNLMRNNQTTQNTRKRLASDSIRQTNESSQSDTDVNVEIPAKKPRNSNYETHNFGSSTQEKLKAQKREYIKKNVCQMNIEKKKI